MVVFLCDDLHLRAEQRGHSHGVVHRIPVGPQDLAHPRMSRGEDAWQVAGFLLAGMATLTPGPLARPAEITRHPDAATGATPSSATGIAVRSAMKANLPAGSTATSPQLTAAGRHGRSSGRIIGKHWG